MCLCMEGEEVGFRLLLATDEGRGMIKFLPTFHSGSAGWACANLFIEPTRLRLTYSKLLGGGF